MPTCRTEPMADGRWRIDPRTAVVAFSGRASRLSPVVRARFTDVRGTVVTEDGSTRVEVEVEVRSLTAGNRGWDELLAAVDPFTASRFPVARYRGTAVAARDGAARVEGELALRGVVRRVELDVRHAASPCGRRVRVRAEGEVDRDAFGVRCDVPGAALVVPRRLRLHIAVDAEADVVVLPDVVPRQRR